MRNNATFEEHKRILLLHSFEDHPRRKLPEVYDGGQKKKKEKKKGIS